MPNNDACASTHLNDPDALLTAAATRDVKLPMFCAAETVSWFQRAEIQFRIKRETSHARMADYVLAALPQDIFLLISSWLLEQGDRLEYDKVKRRLLQKFVATPEERVTKLLALSRQPLGDQRPSVAFQEMKALTKVPQEEGTTQTLDLLRVL